MFLISNFDEVVIGRRTPYSRALFILFHILFLFFAPSSSVSLYYFNFAVLMHVRVFGKILAHDFTFPTAILNGVVFFRNCNYKCTFCIRSEKVEGLKH